MKKLIISGGSGLIGRNLFNFFHSKGFYTINISRNPKKSKSALPNVVRHIEFKDYNAIQSSFEGAEAVVNLSGASIGGGRWTDKYKKVIYNSRIDSTRTIVKLINKCSDPPKAFINASAVGYYGDRGDESLTESSAAGDDFLANVCVNWESEALKASEKTRVILARTGIVLDRNQGALAKMITPYKLFAGGALGSGGQWMSWIHPEDMAALYFHLTRNDYISGAVNICAPNPLTMNEFSLILGRSLSRPSLFKVPAFVLKILLGEQSQLVLGGQRVTPEKAIDSGFEFKYKTLDNALKDILAK